MKEPTEHRDIHTSVFTIGDEEYDIEMYFEYSADEHRCWITDREPWRFTKGATKEMKTLLESYPLPTCAVLLEEI